MIVKIKKNQAILAMAKVEIERKNHELKHLGLIRVAAIRTLVCASNLYEYAKQNSGPLKSTVGTVENAVAAVVSPVCERFKDLPDDVLVFFDKKADGVGKKFDKQAPPLAKQVVSKVQAFFHTASEKAHKFVSEAQTGGPRSALHYAASEYKQFVLTYSVYAWIKLNEYPTIHGLAKKAEPATAKVSHKYNETVNDMIQKGYPIFGYLPLVPVEEIANAFKKSGAEKKGKVAKKNKSGKKSHSESDSD